MANERLIQIVSELEEAIRLNLKENSVLGNILQSFQENPMFRALRKTHSGVSLYQTYVCLVIHMYKVRLIAISDFH